MANEQAWKDFRALTAPLDFLDALLNTAVKTTLLNLDADYQEITGDEARVVAAVAIADTHYKWTSAEALAAITKYLSLRDYLVAQGFIS